MLSRVFTSTFIRITYTLTFIRIAYTLAFARIAYTLTFIRISYTLTFIRITYLYFNINEDVTYILIKFHIHFIQCFKLQEKFNALLFEWSKWIIILGGSSSIANQLRIVFTLTNQLFVFFKRRKKEKLLRTQFNS